MSNNRVYYAIEGLYIAPDTTVTFTDSHRVKGVQSVGMTTTFNLEQVFEIGQLSIYENIENLPDVEMTVQRVFDGWTHAYHLATAGATSDSLSGRSTKKCMVGLGIYPDTYDSASGIPLAEVVLSGMFVSSLAYEFPLEGQSTETLTLIGNNKYWFVNPGPVTGVNAPKIQGTYANADVPVANISVAGSGGVMRREDVRFDFIGAGTITLDANGAVSTQNNVGTILPGGTNGIPGITSSGTNVAVNGVYPAHIQSIRVNTNLGRTPLFELGSRGPYFRFVEFPTEVTCEIDVTTSAGDQVSATEAGVLGNGNNLADKTIKISLKDGTYLNLGLRNKLSSVTHTGGDTGGGNVITTYSFTNFNDLIVSHPRSV